MSGNLPICSRPTKASAGRKCWASHSTPASEVAAHNYTTELMFTMLINIFLKAHDLRARTRAPFAHSSTLAAILCGAANAIRGRKSLPALPFGAVGRLQRKPHQVPAVGPRDDRSPYRP